MLLSKRDELVNNKEKYELGVIKLKETGEVVSKLEEDLKISSVEVELKKKSADEQAEIVGKEKTKVEGESDKASVEAEKCSIIKENVLNKMTSVQKDLDAALPLVEKAQKALGGLNVKDFNLMKAFKSPPPDIALVFSCVLNLLASLDPVVPVDKNGKLKTDNVWKSSLGLMANPGNLISTLESYKEFIDTGKVPSNNFKAIRGTLANPGFTPEQIMSKSSAAAGLCDWVCNITAYYDVVVTVEPKKAQVREAQ
jgi:dynein heavy chain